MTAQLVEMFFCVQTIAFNMRKHVPNMDGRALWESIKYHFDDETLPFLVWKTEEDEKYVESVMSLDEHHESNHFIMQTVRIKRMTTPTCRKFMQIAFNIGQLVATHDVMDQKLWVEFDTRELWKVCNHIHLYTQRNSKMKHPLTFTESPA